MNIVIAIIGSILAIFLIILLHEAGHFFTARALKVRVLKFSIGFGKALYSRVGKSGTEYVIGILPLGGYVRMHGDESDTSSRNDPDAYFAQPLWKRFLIVIAGPLVNFLLAWVVMWGIMLTGLTYVAPVIGTVVPESPAAIAKLESGDLITRIDDKKINGWQEVIMQIMHGIGNNKPLTITVKPKLRQQAITKQLSVWGLDLNKSSVNPLRELGITPYVPPIEPVISQVIPGAAAAKAGMQAGDRIVSINGGAVTDWKQVARHVQGIPNQDVELTVLRDGKRVNSILHIGQKKHGNTIIGFIGVKVQTPKWPAAMLKTERYNVLNAWVPAWNNVWGLLTFKVGVLAKLIVGDMPLKVIGGPISIFEAAGKATLAGWQVYWQFVAIISLSIGFINLLPIPGLDGGHILYQLIELIRRRPLSLRAQQYGVMIGLGLLVILMVQVTFNDLVRIFGF